MIDNSFKKLKEECLKCVACNQLTKTRTNVVFGEGNIKSPLMLIGEGPGETEDLKGVPFVGKAGQLLEEALQDNNLTRNDVYITNTVKCRACDMVDGKKINRPPSEEETNNCRKWLLPQISLIDPELILCIGAPSAKNLIRKNFKITQERGLYFPSNYAKCIMATLHPSYILRKGGVNSSFYELLVKDICKAYYAAKELRSKRMSSTSIQLNSRAELF